MDSPFQLDGKAVLVTGAAKGIGRATAALLSKLGARLIVSDIDEDGVVRTAQAIGARAIKHDVTSEVSWKAAIESIAKDEGRLDVLVNNAGVILNKPFLDTTLEDLRRVNSINVESVWMGMQIAAPLMTASVAETSTGSIVNLSSIYGQVAGPMHAAYCASKGAVRMLTKATAVEFARSGARIRVNSVHPGPVDTDLGMSGVIDAVQVGRFKDIEAGKAAVAQSFPMGRWAQTEDVAGVIAFLASDASRFVTGSELTVDGGWSIV
jgi:NAD(P)-dependent dehydrogenase (short-subunit alcohol dehydrogenase family)